MQSRLQRIYKVLLIALFMGTTPVVAQNNIADKIIAVVGDQVVLKSDVENRFLAMQAQGYADKSPDLKSEIFEDLLIQKLMLAQAQIDSIYVTDQEVERILNRKMDMYIQRIGSKEKLEQYFNKTIEDMKNDFREDTRAESIKEKMIAEITKNIHVTPAEVRAFYKNVKKDSLPTVPGEIQVQQIVKKPKITADERDRIRKKLRKLRDRVAKGESFGTLAVLYSEGPSASRGGELGYKPRAEFVPEFANVAFNLKDENKVSKIVETEYGFHIIQLIDRRGNRINVRHILLKPVIAEKEKERAVAKLDSISNLIKTKKMTFDEAAFYFSDDKNTRNNGGLLINPRTASSNFKKDELPSVISKEVNSLKLEEVSVPFLDMELGKTVYKIIKIKSETKAHTANLADDWIIFENMLKNKKKETVLNDWIKNKQTKTYIHIDDLYKNSNFRFKHWIK